MKKVYGEPKVEVIELIANQDMLNTSQGDVEIPGGSLYSLD